MHFAGNDKQATHFLTCLEAKQFAEIQGGELTKSKALIICYAFAACTFLSIPHHHSTQWWSGCQVSWSRLQQRLQNCKSAPRSRIYSSWENWHVVLWKSSCRSCDTTALQKKIVTIVPWTKCVCGFAPTHTQSVWWWWWFARQQFLIYHDE